MTPIQDQDHASAASPLGKAQAGKYLTFRLGQESYGIAVIKVREILRMLEVTPVPQMPPYVQGVVNLRGKIIPVVDLRKRFRLSQATIDGRTCIVVVQVALGDGPPSSMGMVVDAVEEVVNIQGDDLEKTPQFGARLHADYILGMAKVKGRVKTLLDIDQVIAAEEVAELVQLAA